MQIKQNDRVGKGTILQQYYEISTYQDIFHQRSHCRSFDPVDTDFQHATPSIT